ncbi:ParB/RepB/Spo0J family partition protein [Pantoea sp. Mb-10]|uniref:ParB family protein n=1 Tax=unclassified Pantoea TaxID=2630326 RepID=UPI001E62C061|nr:MULTISPECIES: ParB family protein [unclassified Pantoea]MCE0491075.1 ParB/RepB/Spo0J family partition protein [Pantoea sp. Mb-10]MCE0502564.1 ParB/RepB/Spo0J family partition protein [Pantoea sp. Pb-8]
MSAKRITIGRTFSQTPLQNDNDSAGHAQTFILSTGKRALFTLQHIAAKDIEAQTYVVMETNGRDQSGLTPESLRDIIRTIKLQQFFPAIGVKRDNRIEILDGSRRRAAALHCKTGLDVLVTESAISAEEARRLAQDIQTAREHNLREVGMRLMSLKESGMSQKEIAENQGLSQAKVTRALQAASVPLALVSVFPNHSELSYPDYKTLLQACEKLQETGQTVDALIDTIASDIDSVCARDGLAEDEVKNAILRLVRNGSQSLLPSPAKDSVVTTALWSFADKDRFARKKTRGRMFSYEFNRQSKELQDELDRVINETLSKYLNQ